MAPTMAAEEAHSDTPTHLPPRNSPVLSSLNQQDPEAITAIPSHALSSTPPTLPHLTPNQATPVAAIIRKEARSRRKKLLNLLEWLLTSTKTEEAYYEDGTRYITVEPQFRPYTRRNGVVMFDIHCVDDLISRDFAKTLGYKVESSNGSPIMATIKDESIRCLAEVDVRWHCDQKNYPVDARLNIDNKFYNGKFLVTDANNRFDVIIGARTIEKLNVFNQNCRVAAPGFRNVPKKVEGSPKEDEEKAEEIRKKEMEAMNREYDQKDKNKEK